MMTYENLVDAINRAPGVFVLTNLVPDNPEYVLVEKPHILATLERTDRQAIYNANVKHNIVWIG